MYLAQFVRVFSLGQGRCLVHCSLSIAQSIGSSPRLDILNAQHCDTYHVYQRVWPIKHDTSVARTLLNVSTRDSLVYCSVHLCPYIHAYTHKHWYIRRKFHEQQKKGRTKVVQHCDKYTQTCTLTRTHTNERVPEHAPAQIGV